MGNSLFDQLKKAGLANKSQVHIATGYELIPIVVANKILARDPHWFITRKAPEETAGEDDPYKDYKIPDDLMW